MQAFAALVRDIDAQVTETGWLAGEAFSLADIAYAPYMVRLDHLRMAFLWDRRPAVAAWFDRLRARPGFEAGLKAWFNPDYIALMAEKGEEAKPRIAALAGGVSKGVAV